ncbi:MAG TPA: CDP-alcohol phosphatidyltransferase family protein [Planctomycetota bacterium]|jgi:phosphatidylglycerophosphate synthase|nr:CDP-alcohol phosphatidyltransferase family protein [Planctomycetota bacterium]
MDAPLDRRPIAARDLKVMQATAAWMARRGFSANGISVAGMIFGLLGGAALYSTTTFPDQARVLWVVGAACVQARLLANLFDGMVAIARGTASKVGELYNEVPDRVSDSAILIGLGYAPGGHIILGYGAALAAMMTAYVRAVGKGAGAPNEFCGPMAKQQRMFLVTMTCLFCAFTPVLWQRFGCEHGLMGVPSAVLWIMVLGALVTTVRRLLKIGAKLRGSP